MGKSVHFAQFRIKAERALSGPPVKLVSAVEKAPRMSVPHGVWTGVQASRDRDNKTCPVACETVNPKPSVDPALLPFLMYGRPQAYRPIEHP